MNTSTIHIVRWGFLDWEVYTGPKKWGSYITKRGAMKKAYFLQKMLGYGEVEIHEI